MMFQRTALAFSLCFLPAAFAMAQDPYQPAGTYSPAASYPPDTSYQNDGRSYQPQGYQPQGYQPQGYQPQSFQQQNPQQQSYQPQNGAPQGGAYTPANAPANSHPADRYTPGGGYPASGYTPPPAPGDTLQPAAYYEPGAGTQPAGGDVPQEILRLPPPDPQAGVLPLDGSAPPPNNNAGGGDAGGDAGAEEVVIDESDIVIEETGYVSFFSTKYWDPWEGSVELGLNGTSGNSDTLSIKAGANAKYEDDLHKHTFSINHVNTQQEGITTAQNTISDIRGEWKFPPGPWSLYAHQMTEVDEFKNFDWRIAMDAGVGYSILNNDYTSLSTRAGGSTSREFGGPDDVWVPELAFGLDWRWNISQTSKINLTVDYFPEIGDFENFRMNTKADWETVLNAEWGMSMKVGIFNRYDSTPGDARPSDLNYSVTLLWNF